MFDEWDDVLFEIESKFGEKAMNEVSELIDSDYYLASYLINYYLTSKVC